LGLIELRIGDCVVLRTWNTSVDQIATLHIAAIRRFRQGLGFPVTFVGFQDDHDRRPAGHATVWLHPSMPVVFDYGTDYEPVEVDDAQVDRAMKEMDASELGVIIANASVPVAFTENVGARSPVTPGNGSPSRLR
jgi:hypothetical protein